MAKKTETQLTDESLMAEVQAEIDSMSPDELEKAARAAAVAAGVRKVRQQARVQSEDQKAKQRLYNKKRNARLKLLAEKAQELGITVSDKEIQAAL